MKNSYSIIRPRLFCSRCITFEHCRWNGEIIPNERVELLKKYVDFITTCPEKEIMLGIPREPIRLVEIENVLHMIQYNTDKDLSKEMIDFSEDYLIKLGSLDGIILMDKSPSCGINNTKIFMDKNEKEGYKLRNGMFASHLLKAYTDLPIITNDELANDSIWDIFLRKIYLIADFRKLKEKIKNNKKSTIELLIDFQTRNKLLFMSFNPQNAKNLGKILGNIEKKGNSEVLEHYEQEFNKTIKRNPSHNSHINVIQHAIGYFREKINDSEKKLIFNELNEYKQGNLQLNSLIQILRSWIIRFDEQYLIKQTYFYPYPDELLSNNISDKKI